MRKILDTLKFIWRNRGIISNTIKRLRIQYVIWQDVVDEYGFAFLSLIERNTVFLHCIWRVKDILWGELLFFKEAYPHAKTIVLGLEKENFYGPTKTQVAYQRLRSHMGYLGQEDAGITGAILYIAVSIAYLVEVKKVVELP